MIRVRDLISWAKSNAKLKSLNEPEGFLNGDMLTELAANVKEMEPFDYIPKRKIKDDNHGVII